LAIIIPLDIIECVAIMKFLSTLASGFIIDMLSLEGLIIFIMWSLAVEQSIIMESGFMASSAKTDVHGITPSASAKPAAAIHRLIVIVFLNSIAKVV